MDPWRSDPWQSDPLQTDPWQPADTNRENQGYDHDGLEYPAFAKARGPQTFRISTPDDSEVEGHNRPPPTAVPIAREGGEWPSRGDVERATAEARRNKVHRERAQAEARAARTKKSKPDLSWVPGFMEAEREKERERMRAEEASFTRKGNLPKWPPTSTPPWTSHLPKTGSSSTSQGRNYQAHVHQTRASSSTSFQAGHGIPSEPLPSECHPTPQCSYATKILHGNDGEGILQEAFAGAIRRDISRYSHPDNNQYVTDYLQERAQRGEPGMPKYPLHTYDTSEVLRNSLREINFASHGHRDARDTNIAEYSVAMLWLVANSTSLFPWTRELLRRHSMAE